VSVRPFELILFSQDPGMIDRATGAAAVIVDLERRGKHGRQNGWDTEINDLTIADLRRVRGFYGGKLICRVNALNESSRQELEDAISAGADEILIPMVRREEEVDAALEVAGGRCGVGILVETEDAVHRSPALARRPLSRVYIGLNDLCIDRGRKNIFEPVADGTVERVRRVFSDLPFGFGGLTLPDRGHPIPCRLLICEMARLECDFSFLRRSFHRDILGQNTGAGICRILDAIGEARLRPPGAVERDRRELERTIDALSADFEAKVSHLG
jgi:hypothetical protein